MAKSENKLVETLFATLKSKKISVPKFAEETDIPQDRIYKWKQQGTVLKSEDEKTVTEWLDNLDKNPNTETPSYQTTRLALKNKTSTEIPLYFGNTRAGNIELYSDDPEMNKPVGHLPANIFPGCNHGERVSGDSMYPLICNQAYVVGKIIDKTGVIWGEKYIIHTSKGENIVKFIHPSEVPEHIKIVSHNKQIPPQDLPLNDITFVCRVKYIINPS